MSKKNKKMQQSKASVEIIDNSPLMVYGSELEGAKKTKISQMKQILAGTRRNASSTIERTDRFANIDRGLIPFKYSNYVKNLSTLDVKDAIVLCQKAYYNVSIFRNTIDLMTEFSGSPIYLTGGSQKSKEFFEAAIEYYKTQGDGSIDKVKKYEKKLRKLLETEKPSLKEQRLLQKVKDAKYNGDKELIKKAEKKYYQFKKDTADSKEDEIEYGIKLAKLDDNQEEIKKLEIDSVLKVIESFDDNTPLTEKERYNEILKRLNEG